MKSFDALDIRNNELTVLKRDVVVSDMTFDERRLTSGIILRNDNGTSLGIRPRWGQVYAVGPDQKEVSVGDWILVAHGRWTRGIEVIDAQGEKTLRKVDPDDILCVSDELPDDDTFSTAVHVDKAA